MLYPIFVDNRIGGFVPSGNESIHWVRMAPHLFSVVH